MQGSGDNVGIRGKKPVPVKSSGLRSCMLLAWFGDCCLDDKSQGLLQISRYSCLTGIFPVSVASVAR